MRIRKQFLLLCTILMPLIFNPQLFGQAVTATVVGNVTDNAGEAVKNAKVTISEQRTGISHARLTNQSGDYEFTFLPEGIYTVSVASQGFQARVTKDVRVPVNTTVRVDVTLHPGSVSQSVTVTDSAPLLQTDRADVSAQIESKQVEDLPIGSTRNFQSLESLVPGVGVAIYNQSLFSNAQNSQSFQTNGQTVFANTLQIEGIMDNVFNGALSAIYIPPAAAIQTVDVETSNYAPEFGRATGAVTNVMLKSGTNAFHGSAYEYNQISALSARNYFNNTGPLPRYTFNYTGGAIGGPIFRNHSFFFGDFLRSSNIRGLFGLFTIPTSDFRTGNLTASPTPIYDPNTGNPDGTRRQQFVTNGVPNVIPANRLNPIAQKILALVPEPNVPGAGFTNNYQKTVGFRQISDQLDAKFDQNIRANDRFAYRYSWQKLASEQDPTFGLAGGPGTGYAGTSAENIYSTAGEYTHVFSPTFITEARLGVSHLSQNTQPSDYGSDASTQLGIPGVNISQFTSGITTIALADYSYPLVGYSDYIPWVRSETDIDAVNNWTAIIANHSIKFGGEVQMDRQDFVQIVSYGARGDWNYSEGQTGLNAPGSTTSLGNDFASFLLDVPSQVGREENVGDHSWRQQLYFAFAQDTWQASPKLTLTYGARMAIFAPAYPKTKGGWSQYDPTTNSLEVSGYGNIPNNLGVSVHKDFEPRVGFAYRATPAMVVRGGFGISHSPFPGGVSWAFNYPVGTSIAFNSVNSYTPALNNSNLPETLSQGFPPTIPVVIPSNGIIPNASINSSWTVVNTKFKDPSVMSYNLTVEQSLGRQWVGKLAYVGNQGRQIPALYNLNAGFVAGAGAKGQPEYVAFGRTASTNEIAYGTPSNYNSLQATLTRRYSNGFEWTSSYAWQKAMGYISSNAGPSAVAFYLDYHRNYSPENFTSKQTYAQSFVYELPFGKNKSMFNDGWMSRVAGGWELSGILHIQTGTPLTFTASANQLNAPGNTQVANEVKPFRKLYGIGTSKNWFDTTAFTQPVGPVFGNTGQNIYSGPGLFTLDASAFRSFPIRGSVVLQFRMDAFDVLNHPVFSNPNTSLTSPSFGKITSTLGTYTVNGTPGQPRALQFAGILSF